MAPPVLALALALAAGQQGVSGAPQPKAAPRPLARQSAAPGVEFFEKKIRPVLAEQCYSCHGPKLQQASLRLDTAAGLRKGGLSGSGLSAKPGQDLLLKALRHEGPKMPPQGKLAAPVIADFERWIGMGAPLPADRTAGSAPNPQDMVAGRKHWAFQPVRVLPVPKGPASRWPRRKLDHFILRSLAAQGLKPSPEADRRTLIRRVAFDLTGLPPTFEEVEEFAADPSADAYEKLVDRLLASPAYGERWGRHWLDVARYAEDNPTSEGTNPPPSFPWRYRDWVIQALNADLPYPDFIRRQLAADHIPGLPPTELAALGYLGLSPVYHKELMLSRDVVETIAADEWDERLDTVSRGFLALTVACARCHDHKFDPITTKDYYSLAGVMASTQLLELPLVPVPEGQAEKLAETERQVRQVERDLRRARRQRSMAGADVAKRDAEIAELEAKIAQIKKSNPHYGVPMASVVRDAGLWINGDDPARTKLDYRPGVARDLPVFIRGSVTRPGPVAPRRFLEVLSRGEPRPFRRGSGRLELAEAMVTDAAPLTARVLVNRVWGWHFGRPLVDTPSNFGRMGGRPTHPELLDDLAARFIQNGWSLKWLHREIVHSAAYRQSSKNNPAYYKKDSDNRWLWRMNRRRGELEAWRDSILQVTGTLDRTAGGPSEDLEQPSSRRRTIYGRVSRQRGPDIHRLFDFPDANRHGEARTPTTTPLQQLYFLNSPFVQGQADTLAGLVPAEAAPEEGVRTLFRRILLRNPRPDEIRLSVGLLGDAGASDRRARWRMLAQSLLSSNEFLFVD